MALYEQFVADQQGRKFADVLTDSRIDFKSICDFFEDNARQTRMIEAEKWLDRAPLAGLVRELEARADVADFFSTNDGHATTRFRQAVGALVRNVMANHGWYPNGKKDVLGQRVKVATRTKAPGAYRNDSGLAIWFTRASRYDLDITRSCGALDGTFD